MLILIEQSYLNAIKPLLYNTLRLHCISHDVACSLMITAQPTDYVIISHNNLHIIMNNENTVKYCGLHMWPALPKPATYTHHVKEQFSPSMDSSINELTNCQYTTAKCWLVCFCWGLFLRPVRRPRVLGVSIECHWLACTGNHLTGNHHMHDWLMI